jgi:Flp pilus assembly protein TadD
MDRSLIKFAWILPFLCVTAFSPAYAQSLQEARTLSLSGKFSEAGALFDHYLADKPDDPEALLASAFNHCWQKKYDSAATEFLEVLKYRPDDARALGGLGFNYAWAGLYEQARRTFNRLSKVQPMNVEAEKGLAYTALYSGDSEDAIARFTALAIKYPDSKEYWIALGEADMNAKRTRSAKLAFRQARLIDPADAGIRTLLLSTRKAGAFAEVDAWGGYSSVDGDTRLGMRFIQVTVQAAEKLRVYAKYDNSLSLDNRFFIQADRFSDAWFAGGVYDWNKSLTTKLEYGYRNLTGNTSQQLISFDQVFFVHHHSAYGLQSWHVGGLAGIGSGVPNEYLIYGGPYIALSRRWALEPNYYYSVNSFQDLQQHRFQGAAKYMAPSGLEINGGAYWSTNVVGSSKYPPNHDKVYGVYVFALYPFSNRFTGQVSWRQETGTGATSSISSIAAGLKVRFEK